MIVAVNQPTYLPWLGYFELIARSDYFVFLDTAQYVHHEWNNRNRLKSGSGEPFWLTVPIVRSKLNTPINEILIASDAPNRNWKKKHLNSIKNSLRKAPFFDGLWPGIEHCITTSSDMLSNLNIALILHVVEVLGLNVPIFKASDLGVSGIRTERLRHICQHFGAETYYSPAGSSVYLEEEKSILTDAGVSIQYQHWEHPVYDQLYGGFVSHMSVIDSLMNIGPEKTRELIIEH